MNAICKLVSHGFPVENLERSDEQVLRWRSNGDMASANVQERIQVDRTLPMTDPKENGEQMETQPLTQLDARFSDPGAEPTSWDATREVLETAQLGWLSTLRADGRPHVTPLVPVWLGGVAYFTTGPDEQKSVNLASNANVVLTTGCNKWQDGLDVMVEGEARRITDRQTLERLAVAWASKWDGSWQFEVTGEGFENEVGGPALVFGVEPTKVLAFGKGAFSHTRHVFGATEGGE